MDTPTTNTAFAFDGSYDGFLNIVYGHFYNHWNPVDIVIIDSFQQQLGTNYIEVETDGEKAKKVYNGIQKKISFDAASTAFSAFLADDDDSRFMSIYTYLILGFSVGKDIEHYKHVDEVLKVQKLSKTVLREAHFMKEFSRFTETKAGVFYADISPKVNCLPLIAEHFVDRFSTHAWVIHDVKRGQALVFDGKECLLSEVPKEARIVFSETEENYQALWSAFHETLAIQSRINPKLQKQVMPLRFRKHVTEFKRKR